ncbi:hypothetical protein V6N12_048874 [Hibiscus sabdariffa]|uniref:RNase H type-1 domain-containing protein n=1 Tax=Hibiscus sabdariffa TaxID=183260 RepID=A0ABR2EIX5_9ROSI
MTMLRGIALGNSSAVGGQRPRQHVSRSTPAQGWFKLNSDDTRRLLDGWAKCGGTICDSNGNLIVGFPKGLGVCSAVAAELCGVYTRLGVHGQSASSIVLHIVELCDQDWDISFQHVHREGNKVTDQMTRIVDVEDLEVR